MFYNFHGRKVPLDQYRKLRVEHGELMPEQAGFTKEDIEKLDIKVPSKQKIEEKTEIPKWIKEKLVEKAKELGIKNAGTMKEKKLKEKILEKGDLPVMTEEIQDKIDTEIVYDNIKNEVKQYFSDKKEVKNDKKKQWVYKGKECHLEDLTHAQLLEMAKELKVKDCEKMKDGELLKYFKENWE
jgi:hypothetical protein